MIQKSGRMAGSGQAQEPGARPSDDAVLVLPAEPGRLGLDGRHRPLVAHVEAEVSAEGDAIGPHRCHEVPETPRVVADDVVREAAQIRAEGLLGHALILGPYRLAVAEPP